jgi:hypothetical protein
VITHDGQFELRKIFEKVLPHESRGDRVAAGHHFYSALGPGSAFFRLGCGYEPGTT